MMSLSQKDSPGIENTPTKKKFSLLWSVKKVMQTLKDPSLDFLEKGAIVNSASFCQLHKQTLPYLLNDPCTSTVTQKSKPLGSFK